MPYAHDPAALVRHAVEAGDWRLLELITLMLTGHSAGRSTTAHGAYAKLVLKLGIGGDREDYHRD